MNATLTTVINKISKFSLQRQMDAADMLNMLVDQEISTTQLSKEQQDDVKNRMNSKLQYASENSVNTFFNKRLA